MRALPDKHGYFGEFGGRYVPETLTAALDEFELGGPPTLLGFHRALLSHPCFVAGETCHGIVESEELAARATDLAEKWEGGKEEFEDVEIPDEELVDVE